MKENSTDQSKEIRKLKAQLNREIVKNQRLEQEIEALTINDELTGLFNNRYFENKLPALFYDAARYQKNFCLILAALDRPRKAKEALGTENFENAIKNIGEYLQTSLRKTDWAARVAHEQFAVMLPFTTLNDAAKMADRLRKFVARLEFKEKYRLTASLGVARNTEAATSEQILLLLRERLKTAVSSGRNCVAYKS